MRFFYLAISSLSRRYSAFLASGKASGVLTGLFSFSDPDAALGFAACRHIIITPSIRDRDRQHEDRQFYRSQYVVSVF